MRLRYHLDITVADDMTDEEKQELMHLLIDAASVPDGVKDIDSAGYEIIKEIVWQ